MTSRRVRSVLLGALVVLGLGCATEPWDEFPIAASPSRSCRLAEGDDVYVWRCEGAQRVVVRHRCSVMGKYQCTTARETSACGGRTPSELTIGPARIDQCVNVPAERRWRVHAR